MVLALTEPAAGHVLFLVEEQVAEILDDPWSGADEPLAEVWALLTEICDELGQAIWEIARRRGSDFEFERLRGMV